MWLLLGAEQVLVEFLGILGAKVTFVVGEHIVIRKVVREIVAASIPKDERKVRDASNPLLEFGIGRVANLLKILARLGKLLGAVGGGRDCVFKGEVDALDGSRGFDDGSRWQSRIHDIRFGAIGIHREAVGVHVADVHFLFTLAVEREEAGSPLQRLASVEAGDVRSFPLARDREVDDLGGDIERIVDRFR